jgi:hypothetical protein
MKKKDTNTATRYIALARSASLLAPEAFVPTFSSRWVETGAPHLGQTVAISGITVWQ